MTADALPAAEVAANSAIDDKTEYTEALLSFRHYSNLRFAIFSVFIAITAALVSVLFGKDAIAPGKVATALICIGLWAAIVFLWIEITLDGYVTAFGDKALKINPGSHLAGRPIARRMLIPFATASLHFAVVLFWIAALFG
jgi:hypothetical protein